MIRQTNGRENYTATWVILTRGLQPHALREITGRAFMVAKNRRGKPDREIDRYTERWIYRDTDTQARLNPIVGINESCRCPPTLVIVIVIVIIFLYY